LDVLRICLVIDHLRQGGAQAVLLRLASGLQARGHSVTVISLGPADTYAPKFVESGLDLHVLGYPRHNIVRCARALRSCIADNNPQIAQSFLFKADILTRMVAYGAGSPRLVSSIQWGSGSGISWQSQMYRLTARRCDFVITVSDDSRRYAISELGAARERTMVIPNAVDVNTLTMVENRGALRRTLGIPTDSFTVVSVGRLTAVKSYDVLIDSFKLVNRNIPGARLIIVGDGELRDQLAAQAASLDGKVRFPGYREDAWKFAGAADVFVSASRTEGSSNVLLEAMAQGTPPVATDVAGNNELVKDGRNGLLVPWSDPHAMAAAIVSLHRNRDLASELGHAARATVVNRYSAEKMVAEYEAVYRRIM